MSALLKDNNNVSSTKRQQQCQLYLKTTTMSALLKDNNNVSSTERQQ